MMLSKRALVSSAVLAVSLGFSVSSMAAANGWYVGAGAGWVNNSSAKSDTKTKADKLDDSDFGYKLFGGYQYNQNFALEGSFIDFGSNKYKSTTAASDGKVKTKALNADIVGILPLMPNFSANVKAGLTRTMVNRDGGMSFNSGDKPESGWAVNYGLGAQYNFSQNLGLNVSWDQVMRDNKDSLLSANLVYNFG